MESVPVPFPGTVTLFGVEGVVVPWQRVLVILAAVLPRQPSSFTLNGRQYVAVQSGWGIDARGMQNRLNAIRPGEFPEVPEGGTVWVFALGD